METAQHALLGASSSHRWLECTPSARAEERCQDSGSEFAREGSLAHAIAAKKLKMKLGLPYFTETAEIRELAEYLTGEMEEYTTEYADFVMSRYRLAEEQTPEGKPKPEIRIEQRLDYSGWAPEGFGTGDCVIVGHDRLEIIDFKYGKGVAVEAEENPQMKLYALGAVEEFDYGYFFDRIILTIYQPRIGNISSWGTTISELLHWGEDVVRPLAKIAWRGEGARKSGEWCKFCKVKGDCPRLAIDSASDFQQNPNADGIDTDSLSRILQTLPLIKDWVKAIEDRSLKMALEGEEIPGWKLVEGRSVRKITDSEGAANALRGIGASDDEIFRPRELRTLTDLEKTFGKKEFARVCGGFIEKPAGKPTLVEESDKRKALKEKSDFDNIGI